MLPVAVPPPVVLDAEAAAGVRLAELLGALSSGEPVADAPPAPGPVVVADPRPDGDDAERPAVLVDVLVPDVGVAHLADLGLPDSVGPAVPLAEVGVVAEPVLLPEPVLLLEPAPAAAAPEPDVDGLAWLSEALAWDEPTADLAPVAHDLPLEPEPRVADEAPTAPALPAALPEQREPLAEPAFVVVPVSSPPPFVPAGPPLLDPALLGSVHLGFRDGSTASLDPEQSRALQDLARSLTSSD